ncbi:hypothetical protein FJ959_08885 [Mesorhizobium sp. B2-2-4]|uniref:hypothetical protein n=1 Tax=Mesorhizobium sp. B2-2-4 TaxID=2589962 RepID=UPI001127D36C|nr:hypothetical protein [Mesorhizobium sp. B2-2-4]TPM58979.1 hypothetical protein FJ959_08885 [Mesorhizobium sp. B2-2-4]
MTDLVITATGVLVGANASIEHGFAAAAITAGQVVYKDATGKFNLADTDNASAIVRTPKGVALNGAATGQPVAIVTKGDVTIGGTIEAGTGYWLSGTAGGICPVADVAAGDYPCLIGIGKSTTVLTVDIQAPGVIKV